MVWLYVFLAGFFEIGWIYSLKSMHGFSRLAALIPYLICGFGGAFFMSLALRSLPVGTTYAVWVGIAVTGTTLMGILFFGEPYKFARLAFITMIVIGVIGLKATSH